MFHQFVTWFRAGLGLGLMLFVALTTFSVLNHGANLIEGSAKQGQSKDPGQGFGSVLPKTVQAAPVRVIRNTVPVQSGKIQREEVMLVAGDDIITAS